MTKRLLNKALIDMHIIGHESQIIVITVPEFQMAVPEFRMTDEVTFREFLEKRRNRKKNVFRYMYKQKQKCYFFYCKCPFNQ